MDWTLEVVVVPVSAVDRARDFYRDKLGFEVDVDKQVTADMRIVQLTPPGSGCSIVIGEGIGGPDGGPKPGSYAGLQLVVADIKAAHAERMAHPGHTDIGGQGRGTNASAPSAAA
jgi:catechol 2,3-dioxygenase-like lactoylglutathione lyase family enzyme